MKPKEISISLPFGLGGAKFVPNESERRAAWILYVELSTRISVRPIARDAIRVRTALDSFHTVCKLTRQVLHEAGPEVAHGQESLGPVMIEIVNKGIAPFLTCWHNRLQRHEEVKPEGIPSFDHERSWEHFDQMFLELEKLQNDMRKYVSVLGKIAGIS